jgi:DNA-binding MarR family transcriptional regulator
MHFCSRGARAARDVHRAGQYRRRRCSVVASVLHCGICRGRRLVAPLRGAGLQQSPARAVHPGRPAPMPEGSPKVVCVVPCAWGPRAVNSGDVSRNGKTGLTPAGGWLGGDQQRAWLAYIRVQLRLAYEMNRQLLADSAMSLADYDVLTALSVADGGRMPITALAAQIGWERSRVSHHVRRMSGRGLVACGLSAADRRVTEVTLTAQGRQAMEEAAPGMWISSGACSSAGCRMALSGCSARHWKPCTPTSSSTARSRRRSIGARRKTDEALPRPPRSRAGRQPPRLGPASGQYRRCRAGPASPGRPSEALALAVGGPRDPRDPSDGAPPRQSIEEVRTCPGGHTVATAPAWSRSPHGVPLVIAGPSEDKVEMSPLAWPGRRHAAPPVSPARLASAPTPAP